MKTLNNLKNEIHALETAIVYYVSEMAKAINANSQYEFDICKSYYDLALFHLKIEKEKLLALKQANKKFTNKRYLDRQKAVEIYNNSVNVTKTKNYLLSKGYKYRINEYGFGMAAAAAARKDRENKNKICFHYYSILKSCNKGRYNANLIRTIEFYK